jgi:hydroxymethylpyrimidine/phosphomethylpyrimidine kinase
MKHQALNSKPSEKHQAPTSNIQRNSKHQHPNNPAKCLELVSFVLLWSLELGVWFFCANLFAMRIERKKLPIALTIAGSDSGGGAGIQADLKTFAALGVHGTSAITCITAQNPKRVLGIEPCSPKIVRLQIEAVFDELPPAAIKTGMLYSVEIIRTVAKIFKSHRRDELHESQNPRLSKQFGDSCNSSLRIVPLVVDPVMVATSGAMLLKPSALRALQRKLLPLATLTTPNLDEAEILTGRKLKSPEDLRAAAREIHQRFGCAALVKGGHLRGGHEAIDVLFDGANEWLLSAPFVRGVSTHGTGCTYSAAITAYLALGCKLPEAVRRAKIFITKAIAQSQHLGEHSTLNNLWCCRK